LLLIRLGSSDPILGESEVIPGPKFRLQARLNCDGNVGTRARDLLCDRQEDILVGNEALPS